MPTVNQLTIQQLENPQIKNKVEALVFDVKETGEVKRALFLLFQLEFALAKIKENKSSVLKEYQSFIAIVSWVAFPVLDDERAQKAVSSGLVKALIGGIDVEAQLNTRLFVLPVNAREALAKNLRTALEKNTEMIGNKEVGQWIELYNQFEDFLKRNNLSANSFFNQSISAKELNSREIEVLREIFDVYDNILIKIPLVDEEMMQQLVQSLERESEEVSDNGKRQIKQEAEITPSSKQQEQKQPAKQVSTSSAPGLSQDKYREPIAQKDLANKYKNIAPQPTPDQPGLKSKDAVIVNPLNIVDLRRDQK